MHRWVAFVAILLLLPIACSTVFVEIPVNRQVESAAEVGGLENKFVKTVKVGFGGGAAGGLGAPIIHASSAEQFMELVHPEEPVYTAFSKSANWYSCQYTYWAFLENRAGLVQFVESYAVASPYRMYCTGEGEDGVVFTKDTKVGQLDEIREWAESNGYKFWTDDS